MHTERSVALDFSEFRLPMQLTLTWKRESHDWSKLCNTLARGIRQASQSLHFILLLVGCCTPCLHLDCALSPHLALSSMLCFHILCNHASSHQLLPMFKRSSLAIFTRFFQSRNVLIQKRHPYIGILNSTQKHLATVKTCFYIVEMIYFSTTCENSNT